jgi:ABC-2 type transport system permease protein
LIGRLLVKDVLRRTRNPAGFLLLLVLPLLFALLMGLAFGPSNGKARTVRITLLVDDRDDSFGSRMIRSAFNQGELASLFDLRNVEGDSGRALMEAGKASALLVIPAGFGDSVLHHRPAELQLVKNPSEAFGPKIAEETVRMFAEGGDRMVRIADAPLRVISRQNDLRKEPPEALVASIAVQFHRLIDRVSTFLVPPKIVLDEKTASTGEGAADPSAIYTGILSSLSVMFLLFILDALSRDIHEERRNKTLIRLRAGPAPVSALIAAKILFVFGSGLAAQALVWSGACLLFGVRMDAGRLALFIPFSVVLVAALTGVVFAIQGLSRDLRQAQAFSPAVILTFSMLGGAMIPVRNLPGFLQKAANASPVTWGVQGLQAILLERAGPAAVFPAFCVLSAIAWILLILSFFLLRRKAESWV